MTEEPSENPPVNQALRGKIGEGPAPMMKCGHVADAYYYLDGTPGSTDTAPCCKQCAGVSRAAYQIDEEPASLAGRTARCIYWAEATEENPKACRSEVPSATTLAWFEAKPAAEHDSYYCGCLES